MKVRFLFGPLISALALTASPAWAAPKPANPLRQPPPATRAKVAQAAYQEPEMEMEEAPSVLRQEVHSAPPASAAIPPAQSTIVNPSLPLQASEHPSYHREYDPRNGFACEDGYCAPCQQGPLWVSAEYILWWRSGMDLPPLVTTAPDGTPQAVAGEIGQPTTRILWGDGYEDYPVRPGGRVSAGLWLDCNECWAIGGSYYWLGDAESNYSASSTGSPILAIPFTEGGNGTQDARLIGFPGTFSGNLNFTTNSEVFGGDIYLRSLWCCPSWGRIDLLVGYQHARINEGIVMDSFVSDNLGASSRVIDTFRTTNEFHGVELGFLANIDRGCYFIDITGKVGLGNMYETVSISGTNTSAVGATQVTTNGGLFTQASNIGNYSRDEFVAVPEFGIKLGWHLTECIDFTLGYNVIYFSGVVRPGDAIDTTVNTSQVGGTLVGAARPAFEFTDSHMVLHGLNFGVTYKW